MGAAGAGVGGMAAGGTGGTTAGTGGAAGMTGGTGGTTPPTMAVGAPCITAGSQVVFIGDSYSNYAIAHTSVSTMMEQRATMGGALMAGGQYADYSAPGTTLAGTFASIPPQWENNKSKVPIHLVIMDGGGNDVLIDNPSCLAANSHMNATCMAVVDRSMMMAKTLWASMKAAGVKDVIWFWYPHIPGALSGNGHDINDYTLEILIKLAAEATTDDFRVYMVDTIPLFSAFPDSEVYFPDGVHANDKGTGLIADAIWKLMKDKCIGQAPSSGCCKQ
jgi:lysophospholipase L1-like esterase